MRIRNVRIKNFRALQDLSIDFSNMTVIIGENDCGKTSIMLALKLFFDGKKLTDRTDYFKKNTNTPIVGVRPDFLAGLCGPFSHTPIAFPSI